MKEIYLNMAKKVLDNSDFISFDEFKNYLFSKDEAKEKLKEKAIYVRNEIIGNRLYVRGSIEYSNYCDNNCGFCGMASSNNSIKRYRLTPTEAYSSINIAYTLGIKQIHIVSGESMNMDIDEMCQIVQYAANKGLSVTLVLGELTEEKYRQLYASGATRYIIKFETSNKKLFSRYKGKRNLKQRISNLFLLREIGYKIGTGNIIGLPETCTEDLYNDLVILYNIKPDMASSSIFTPNLHSKLGEEIAGDKNITINFISLMRLFLKNTPIIPCSSALGFDGQIEALLSGANLVSCHLTPSDYSDLFSMYYASNRAKTEYESVIKLSNKTKMEITDYV